MYAGMGFHDIAIPFGMPTPFDEMIEEKLVPASVFSVFMSNHHNGSDDSVLLFGGVDTQYYQGDVMVEGGLTCY